MWSEKFNKVLTAMQQAGEQYADAKETAWYLQEMCSVMKSSLTEKALADNPKLSHVRAEDVAKASDEYAKHLKGTAVAIGIELKAKAKYNKLSNQFEAYRSLISLDKKLEGKSGSESEQLEYETEE